VTHRAKTEAIKAAIIDVLHDDAFWKELDHTLNKELKQGYCKIKFGRHGAKAFVGGSANSNVAHEFHKPKLYFEIYQRPAQVVYMEEQIAGIDRFIKKLEQGRAELQRAIDDIASEKP
jgi:hypothetical protein